MQPQLQYVTDLDTIRYIKIIEVWDQIYNTDSKSKVGYRFTTLPDHLNSYFRSSRQIQGRVSTRQVGLKPKLQLDYLMRLTVVQLLSSI